ncbi:MAG TPA: DUF6264 family protein [Mycobacteriales bacterium]|nr:DUF6264 family protein [Mycobacteriales bacterium]
MAIAPTGRDRRPGAVASSGGAGLSTPESPDDHFPRAPQYHPDHEGEPAPVDRPREVDWATALLLVTAVLGVITTIIQLTDKSGTIRAIRNAQPDWSDQKVQDAYNTGRWISIVLGGVFFVLYVMLVLQLRRGRNWARIVVTVLLGLGVISGLSSVSQPATAANKTLGVLGLVIDIAVLVLLYLKPSAEYYRADARRRVRARR